MIQKIRDLTKIGEHIESIQKQVKNNASAVTNMKSSIDEQNNSFGNLKDTIEEQNELLDEFSGQIKRILELKQEFEKEIYDFKLLKSQMQRKIMDKIETEIREEMHSHFDKLKTDADQFNSLKKDIEIVSARTRNLSAEIEKFQRISSSIKEKDFELEKYAKELAKTDSEKLSLIKRIDTLERLIAKMRKGPGHSPQRRNY